MDVNRGVKYIDELQKLSDDDQKLLAAYLALGTPLTGTFAKFEPDRATVAGVLGFFERAATVAVPA